jgi:FG-GAP-like repeat
MRLVRAVVCASLMLAGTLLLLAQVVLAQLPDHVNRLPYSKEPRAGALGTSVHQRSALPQLVLSFANPVSYGSGGYEPSAVAVDVDGDGKPDLVVANTCALGSSCPGAGSVGVLLGNGDGTFQAAVAYASGGGYGALSVAVADVNYFQICYGPTSQRHYYVVFDSNEIKLL